MHAKPPIVSVYRLICGVECRVDHTILLQVEPKPFLDAKNGSRSNAPSLVKKHLRAQEIAKENNLPCIYLGKEYYKENENAEVIGGFLLTVR